MKHEVWIVSRCIRCDCSRAQNVLIIFHFIQNSLTFLSVTERVEVWTVFFPGSNAELSSKRREGRGEMWARVNCENRGAPAFSLNATCHLRAFSRNWFMPLTADAAIVRGRPVSLSIQTNWPPADRPRALSLHWTIRGAKREKNGDAPRPDAGKSCSQTGQRSTHGSVARLSLSYDGSFPWNRS